MNVKRGRTGLWIVGQLLISVPALAQASISAGPFVGDYLPLGNYDQASTAGLPQRPLDLRGPAFGGDAEVWFGRSIGISVEAGGTRSTIPMAETPEGNVRPSHVNVETATAQALFPLAHGFGDRTWVSAGLGVVRHTGTAYAQYGPPSDGAAVLGAGSEFDLGHKLAITTGVTSTWYKLNILMPASSGSGSGSLQSGWQMDLTLKLGVMWAIVPRS